MKTFAWIVIALLSTSIGIYPVLYFITDMSQGILSFKPESLLNQTAFKIAFNMHIIGGGICLLVGWLQFVEKFRNSYLHVHRAIGKTYILSCLLSGIGAFYLAFYATGGIVSELGFGTLALLWLYTTLKAYMAIRARRQHTHRAWMIRSFALAFAAVTLRIWLPLAQIGLHMDFISAYQVIAWLCWVPNLIVAEWIVRRSSAAQELNIT